MPAPAQVATPPERIPTPPIPTPPQLGPAPKYTLGKPSAPPRPAIAIPGPAAMTPVVVPPEGPITVADKNDTTPLPPSGKAGDKTSMVSPGANMSQIQEVAFLIDSGGSQIPATAEIKLRDIAKALAEEPASRLEIRIYSPSKPRNESAAHRLSLARFLAIRDFLTKNGVDDRRIDGRPLISDPAELNADRVELYIER